LLTSALLIGTAVGAFVIAIAPGWFGALVAIQTVNGA